MEAKERRPGRHVEYVIDGNNLLHAARAYLAGPPGRGQLCATVGRWAAGRGIGATIIFDGPEPRAGVLEQMRQAGVAVRFSPGRPADELIEDIIDAAALPRQLTIVSSDGAVRAAGRRRGCPCIQAEAFAKLLVEDRGPEVAPPALPEKPTANREETDGWLEAFGLDPGSGPAVSPDGPE
ncbi:MAG: NYN domain-containing protein [Phycisphaerae bacterium]|nr:NYN domain-containing protein [Phycisphaerae bacterium]